jgi:hypothetical protein
MPSRRALRAGQVGMHRGVPAIQGGLQGVQIGFVGVSHLPSLNVIPL